MGTATSHAAPCRPGACPARLEAQPRGVGGLHGPHCGPPEGACHGEAPALEARVLETGSVLGPAVSLPPLRVHCCPSSGEPSAHAPATPGPLGPRGHKGNQAPRSETVTLETAERRDSHHGACRCPTTPGDRPVPRCRPSPGSPPGACQAQALSRGCLLGQPPAMGPGSTPERVWGWSQSPVAPGAGSCPEVG